MPGERIFEVDKPARSNTSASFYLGKRIAFVYRASKEVRGTKIRAIWGKVTRTHGSFWVEKQDTRIF